MTFAKKSMQTLNTTHLCSSTCCDSWKTP